MRDARDKSFGIGEEYRVNLRLFDRINAAIDTQLADKHNLHTFFAHSTPLFLDFV